MTSVIDQTEEANEELDNLSVIAAFKSGSEKYIKIAGNNRIKNLCGDLVF